MERWHCLGDSHVRNFRDASVSALLDLPCVITEVGGATAVGLRNPNSLTDAVGIYKKMLHPASPGTIPLIHLGEVDCGFVIWYRSQKYNESIMGQLEQSIAAYFQFVDDLITIGFASVVITGATLPTIRDGQDFGDVANARREIVATLVERTSLTLLYNKHLRAGAKARALPYIDISSKVLDIETGVVADFFRHPDPSDHHLDPQKVSPMWAIELNQVGKTLA